MAGKRKAPSGATGSTGGATKRPPGRPGTAEKSVRKPKKPKTWKTRLKRAALYTVVAGVVFALLGVGAFAFLYSTTDIPEANEAFETQTTYVYYQDGKSEIGQFAVQNRDVIGYDEIPQDMKDAVVAAENRSFWSDNGIDVKGIARAAFSNASGNATQGASTITQQYVKILYLSQERSYTRKVKEAILSLKLQRTMSKKEILAGYLNTIYFGRGAYGVQAAAEAFFKKSASELTLQECAVLASVINNPTRFDADNGKDSRKALRERYRYVLEGMAESGDITADEATQASRKLPTFPPVTTDSTYGGQKGHVLSLVKDQLLGLTNAATSEPFTEGEIDGGGLRITTTFTKQAMQAAEDGVAAVRPEGFSDKELHVGVASVEPGTGALRGMYAGQDYLDSQINWAIAGGQAGSSLKPFAVTAALESGFSLKDTFEGNSPFELPDGTEIRNQGDTDYGSSVSLLKATEDSINTAFVDLTDSIPDGPQKVMDTMNVMGIPRAPGPGKHDYGIPKTTPGLEPFLGIALGSATVSPINMANAYGTIAAGGRFASPYVIDKVVNADGETLYDHRVSDQQVIKADDGIESSDGEPIAGSDIAADVSYAMQQVVQSGSGTAALSLGRPAAGKTGTSTNDQDDVVSSWFTGFTPQLATSVMYVRGKGNGKLDGWLPSYFGGSYPAETWTSIMEKALDGTDVEDFPEPAYVDGEAPDDGHSPTPTYTPPPSTPKPTQRPTQRPTDTQVVPTPTIPTQEPTTQQPTPTPTPTPVVPTPTPTPTPEPPVVTPTPTPTPTPVTPTTPAAATATPAARMLSVMTASWLGRLFW
ncbi:transglycosylase domain-containing protein [Nocardioides flavescens]|uniref:Penicillin-binding protein n=1 Tax=Nocardioides flavescens TaxID=2691959 RepID=A0A6L7F381_9ACTN|nr:penicillin-binding protein [Nocardioides flavescens]